MPSIDELLAAATLKLTATSDSAALDSEVLLGFILKKDRCYLRAWSEKKPTNEQIIAFNNLIKQRVKGLPIAYLTGLREFWSREFKVNADVLIPRADTELLIELSLPLIPKNKSYKVLDLGTGSGIIAITLAAERPNAYIVATDVSLSALKVATENAAIYDVKHIYFQQSNWFTKINPTKFDLIISNPPYIAINDLHLQQGDLRFEPQLALIAKDNGLKDISTIVNVAVDFLKPNGQLLIEHGYQQQQAVENIFQRGFYHSIQSYTDLSRLPRVSSGKKL